jgi:uncharacterized protein (TIGR02145 family)
MNSSQTLTANFWQKCGTRSEIFDSNIYKCVNNSKIYLKTPVSYGGEDYEAVLIGTQTWMAKNLNYSVSGSKCIGASGTSGNLVDSGGRCGTYGRLYSWAIAMNLPSSCNSSSCASSVRGICPEGWHIPSHDEWITLTEYAGGFSTAGTKLKAASGWNSSPYDTPIGTDDYGFSALPSSLGNNSDGNFINAGLYGYWWSSTEISSGVSSWFMGFNNVAVSFGGNSDESYLRSVRCIKD